MILIFYPKDFGLSTAQTPSSSAEGDIRVPTRWVAPEVLNERKFSQWSDVWSFGVTLWELFENGAVPYNEKKTNWDVRVFVTGGGRLTKPENCPDQIWEIIEGCWKLEPNKRKPFKTLVVELTAFVSQKSKLELRANSDKEIVDFYN